MKDGWNANGHTIPIKQFHYERKPVMTRILNIVLILALVLLPFTPVDAYADEDTANTVFVVSLVVGGVLLIVSGFAWLLEHNQFSDNGDEQETLLAEQLEQLEPIENVGSQTNFTPTENANVHGAMYPVFEW